MLIKHRFRSGMANTKQAVRQRPDVLMDHLLLMEKKQTKKPRKKPAACRLTTRDFITAGPKQTNHQAEFKAAQLSFLEPNIQQQLPLRRWENKYSGDHWHSSYVTHRYHGGGSPQVMFGATRADLPGFHVAAVTEPPAGWRVHLKEKQ